jgi:hypothetical protein
VNRCLVVLEKALRASADSTTKPRHSVDVGRNEDLIAEKSRPTCGAPSHKVDLDGGAWTSGSGRHIHVWVLQLNECSRALPVLVHVQDAGWDFFLMRKIVSFNPERVPHCHAHARHRVAFAVFEVADDVFRGYGCELTVVRSAA